MLPVIGVIPLWDSEKNSLWMLPGYMEGVLAQGGLPVMLPLTDDENALERACALCAGFLLTGGQDVQPALYGEEALPVCGEVCPARDRMEVLVLRYALAADRPVLGICRGIQFLNAHLGGTLYQDLPSQRPSGTEHHQRPPYDLPCHPVRILPGTPLRDLLGTESLAVNSYHHQAIRSEAPDLRPMAVSQDGLTEAVWMPGRRMVWGVQWHPEFSWRKDPSAAAIFRAFVSACGDA